MLHWSLVLGLPPSLVGRIHQVLAEELEHAELSRRVHVAAGGSADEVQILQTELSSPLSASQGIPRRALFSAFQDFAVHESIALTMFRVMQNGRLEPVVRRAVDQIVRDEARHRFLGWQLVGALLQRTGEREWLTGIAGEAIQGVLSAYRQGGPPIAPEDAGWGLIDPQVQALTIQRALAGGIAKNMARLALTAQR